MPAMNFSAQFAEAVESGRKTQSIRAPRKVPIRVGDWLALYIGQRRLECRKLGEAVVEAVLRVRISSRGVGDPFPRVWVGSIQLGDHDLEAFAREDGFDGSKALGQWFAKTHGLPFEGVLIRWRLLPRENWRKP